MTCYGHACVEFTYNNGYQASIQMTPYEAIWKVMSISNLLDEGGREICYRSGFGKGHLGKGGHDTKVSSHGSKPIEELRQQTVATPRV